MRLAAIVILAVVGTDLAGFDCSRLVASMSRSPSGEDSGANAGAPDCLCCSTADASPTVARWDRHDRLDRAHLARAAATLDGVARVPYRPPLLGPFSVL